MPQYVFYPGSPEGYSASMQVFDLACDLDAVVRAEQVLNDHRSSRSVAVWLDDRMVLTLFRRRAAAPEKPEPGAPAFELA